MKYAPPCRCYTLSRNGTFDNGRTDSQAEDLASVIHVTAWQWVIAFMLLRPYPHVRWPSRGPWVSKRHRYTREPY
jgi:hypothetical protein